MFLLAPTPGRSPLPTPASSSGGHVRLSLSWLSLLYSSGLSWFFLCSFSWVFLDRCLLAVGIMGSGDRHLLNSLLHHLHGAGGGRKDHHHGQRQQHQPQVPKGCLAVMVGQEEEEQQRFVVPVAYLSHPLFMQLLKEAENEYGFEHKGAIALPCHVAEFRCVQGLIDRELHHSSSHHGGAAHGRHHHHHHLVACFRA
ncbi:hypothetical protein Taro_017245 [Colocasia esculenta]|uniref:Auxin-responsive protein SAUR32 n=1 Tax=Colocasia esculenta TaxID=4460 RepID=A0A843USM7_COLES|nr:hypothetical protein [Colocasia esculenta]